MNVHKLDSLFHPQRIALLGISSNPKSVGGLIISNLVSGGFRGVIYPVNPTIEAVQGMPCFPDLASLPRRPDLAMICAAAEKVPQMVRDCGEAGVKGVIIVSAGFREAGEAGKALERDILQIKKQYDGMRIIGPNCLGVIAPGHAMNASFGPSMPKKGNVAFISQSGALCTSVLDWAAEQNIGFSYFVSIGNTLDVDFGDLIDYFGEDEETEAIILYIESVDNARHFLSAARAFARSKPIIVYKAGRFPQSAAVAASHTGALAAEDAVYEAAFRRAGMARVFQIDDVFHCAELLGRKKIPRGSRLGIVTNAGGPGVMATDALIAAGGELAKLSDETLLQLDENLPPMWSHGNPVDVLGDAKSKRLAKAVKIVLDDKGVDAVLVILTPQAMTNATAAAKALAELAAQTRKPILAAWMGGQRMAEGTALLGGSDVPTYLTPEQGVRAFMTLVEYARNLDSLYQTPRDLSVKFALDREAIRQNLSALTKVEGLVSEVDSKALLEAYGLATTRPRLAATADEAVQMAESMGTPVVLKIQSPDITHKSDAGGVKLDLRTAQAVHSAFDDILAGAQSYKKDAQIEGVTVQPFVNRSGGVELILGIKRDPVFGTVILVGAGGTTAELYRDSILGFPPLNENLALRMLRSLKIWPLLKGYRGSDPVNLDRLIEALLRLSQLAAHWPEIAEADINPLLVTPETAVALDARLVMAPIPDTGKPARPYAHMALRPYPEEWVRPTTLEDGTPVLLRPIKPEDEPLWFALLGSCSRESIYMRFRYAFHWDSHDVASRYCYNDYDREIAIVAEIEEDGQRKLLAVGRLIADPDHETAEYAILIADAWQNRGLGGVLTDYCMAIAQQWGIRRLMAQTTTDNHRMISVFEKRGFEVQVDPGSSMVEVEKAL